MYLLRNSIILACLLWCTCAVAQKEQTNWYFGRFAAISFENGTARARYDNPQNIYGRTASISDPITGKLLFYTDALTVWNHQHRIMANGGGISVSSTGDVIIFPVPGSSSEYYIFFVANIASLQYVIVDMNRNGGGGEVITTAQNVTSGITKQIAVIRHQYTDAYWVIVHENNNNRFKTYLVDTSGVSLQPIISNTGLTTNNYGDLVGSSRGDKLAATHYYGNDYKVEVFDFDRVCGRVNNAVELYREPTWDYPYGIAFSPDDTRLYVTYSYQSSQLVQYYGPNYQNSFLIASSPQNYNIMRPGPDNRIYMATHDNNIPGDRINAILAPDALAAGCNFRETYLNLDEGAGFRRSAQFELPMFATGKRLISPTRDSIFSYSGSCTGDTVKFRFNTGNVYDSLLWNFGDGSKESTSINPVHFYTNGGRFAVKITIFRCGTGYTLTDTLSIDSFPWFRFPTDTSVCAGAPVVLGGPEAQKHTWSTGESTRDITATGTGILWLSASNGNCTVTDTINILNYPDPVTQLGDEYFLCEDDAELARLDAGEGFTYYKWTPTEDTTQWIIVKSTGNYFVKVTDNNECIGNDHTRVKRLCGVILHFPNAFTPNNDGLNDVYKPLGTDVIDFQITIYNRWGETVFTSNQFNKGWDGSYGNKPASDGVYTYIAEYTGYRHKRKQSFQKKGNITLLR